MPPFENAVKISDAQWMMNESRYYRDAYDMRLIPTELENRLEKNEHTNNPIQGICWYNILANTIYQQRFAYISAALEDGIKRSDLIVDGDDDGANNDE